MGNPDQKPAGRANVITTNTTMKRKRKSRHQAPITRPTGGPVFVSTEDQKGVSLDNRCKVNVLAALSNLFMVRHELLCKT